MSEISALLGAIVALTAFHLVRTGVTPTTLRESVIGFYGAWALVGLVLAGAYATAHVARAIAMSAMVATWVYGVFVFFPTNPFTTNLTPRLVDAAGGLYVSFLVLAAIFAPSLVRNGFARVMLIPVAVLALVEIALKQTRSIWVALLVGSIVTALVAGAAPHTRTRLARFALLGAALLIVASLVAPRSVAPLHAEFRSIYVDEGGTSAANAAWRLSTSREAFTRLASDPVAGIGMAEPTAHIAAGAGASQPAPLHNSFLAFALRLGVPGFLLLALFQLIVVLSARRVLAAAQSRLARERTTWLLACQLVTAGHALFTPVLQSPYMGLFFWFFGGLIIGSSRFGAYGIHPAFDSSGPRAADGDRTSRSA